MREMWKCLRRLYSLALDSRAGKFKRKGGGGSPKLFSFTHEKTIGALVWVWIYANLIIFEHPHEFNATLFSGVKKGTSHVCAEKIFETPVLTKKIIKI